jgi:hypothetical protein
MPVKVKVKPSRSLYYGGRLYTSGDEFNAGEDFDRWQHVDRLNKEADDVKTDVQARAPKAPPADKAIKGGQVRKK